MTQFSLITTVLTIDASEFDSSTSASPVVINTSMNTVFIGDKVWAAISASGTGVTYVSVSPTFMNMP